MNPYRVNARIPSATPRLPLLTKWAVVVAYLSVGLAAFTYEGCSPQQGAENAAETAFTADLLQCVDKATTLAESKACRAEVHKKWGVTEVSTKDGGGQ